MKFGGYPHFVIQGVHWGHVTWLSFSGRCGKTAAFCSKVLGGQVQMMLRFKESPEPVPAEMLPPGDEEKIMHASIQIGDTLLMLDDGGLCGGGGRGRGSGRGGFSGFSLSYNVADEVAAKALFAALGEGGGVTLPIGKTFWSPCFGTLKNGFGVTWMVSVSGV